MGDLRQEVARALWDTYRASDINKSLVIKATPWEELVSTAGQGSQAAQAQVDLGMAEADAAIAVVLERLREPWERVEKAHVVALKSKGEILGEATLHPDDWDELGNAIFAVHQLLYALAKEQQP